ncbi:conserved hypothetical protein [Vibrio phage 193E37-1]|nr:conserved hypothetical protein [Vibrio phage 193E37-1]
MGSVSEIKSKDMLFPSELSLPCTSFFPIKGGLSVFVKTDNNKVTPEIVGWGISQWIGDELVYLAQGKSGVQGRRLKLFESLDEVSQYLTLNGVYSFTVDSGL